MTRVPWDTRPGPGHLADLEFAEARRKHRVANDVFHHQDAEATVSGGILTSTRRQICSIDTPPDLRRVLGWLGRCG